MFTPIEPTVHNICEFNFEKLSSKIRDIRPDTLSNIMTMANVRPGSKLLVVEDVHGLIVAAAVERMGGRFLLSSFSLRCAATKEANTLACLLARAGQGQILVINDVDSPPDLHLLDSFNFSPTTDLSPISSIHWAATERDWSPPDLPLELENEDSKKPKNSRDVAKIKRRRGVYEKAKKTREEFFKGGFDGCVSLFFVVVSLSCFPFWTLTISLLFRQSHLGLRVRTHLRFSSSSSFHRRFRPYRNLLTLPLRTSLLPFSLLLLH